MATIPSDAYRATAAPFDADTTVRALDLTASDAEIALETGLYEVRRIGGALGAWCRLGSAATSLASLSTTALAGFYVAVGDVVTFWHDASRGDGKFHALLEDTGTEGLLLTRKAGA